MRQLRLIALLLLAALAACDRSAPPPPKETAAETTAPPAPTPDPAPAALPLEQPLPPQPAAPRHLALTNQTADTCVASQRSAAFHSPDCEFAQTISKANLLQFKNRDEAITSGRTPCGKCRP